MGSLRFDNQCGPVVMGVLNVTPDSFSDGGAYLDPVAALDRASVMIEAGAAIIDVGPESTRPGSDPVSDTDQVSRCVPVIGEIRARYRDIAISIDTRSSMVAREALAAGATIVNDVSAMRDDPGMCSLIASAGGPVILMHRRGTSVDMQVGGGPVYDDVVAEVTAFLADRIRVAEQAGVLKRQIVVDPGIGFGKRVDDNLSILAGLDRIRELGCPVLVGASRKRFIGSVLGESQPEDYSNASARLGGSVACALWAAQMGAAVVRVHDVAETVGALKVWSGLRGKRDDEFR